MQVAIEIVGAADDPRAGIGAVGKLVGKRGWFWIVAGHRVSEIDGFIPEDMFRIRSGAFCPAGSARRLRARRARDRHPNHTADANYIDVQVLGVSKAWASIRQRCVRCCSITAGQGNKMTPFVLVRKVK